jgi:hypothetical protein
VSPLFLKKCLLAVFFYHLAALLSAVHVRKIRDFPDCRAFALSTKQNTKKCLLAVIFLFLCTLVRSARPKNQRFSGLTGFRPINEANNKKVPASSHFLLFTSLALLNAYAHYTIPF